MIKLPEGVWFFTFDKTKLKETYEKLKPFCSHFGNDGFRDPVEFVKLFYADDSVILETDFGLMIVFGLEEGHKAEVHLVIYDHKLSEHQEIFQNALIWLFLQHDLQRVETFVHRFAKSVKRFLEQKMNFTYEGTLRQRAKMRGQFYDIDVYSILRDEVMGG